MSRKAELFEFDPFVDYSSVGGSGHCLLYNESKKYAHRAARKKDHDAGWRPVYITFIQRGAYTYAEAQVESKYISGRFTGVGFSKRRPTDKYNEQTGKLIALRRAIEDAVSSS